MYRRTLDVRSGVGQLVHAQAVGLRAVGARVRIACRRGRWRYLARTRWPAHRLSESSISALNENPSYFVVDHELELPGADLIFAHGLIAEAIQLQSRPDWAELLAREKAFFVALNSATPVVTCSELMKTALNEHYEIDPERVHVHYPGYRATAFDATHRHALRAEARRKLGLDDATPVIGFVTSGDFATRGLDILVATAERIRATVPAAKFLVVGSKALPEWARAHALVAAGHVLFRPKSSRPEVWMSALDLFLYTSRFDAFGIVLAEAQALGIPVLTSRRVGAAECLPHAYEPWLIDTPDSEAFAAHALKLLHDSGLRRALAAAGTARVVEFSRDRYVAECVATILSQNV
jgi:UDP-glucose:(heptosyl)LPS alpha-1,3-glucosyltransferase